MSKTLPIHSHLPHTPHTYSRGQVIAAIHDFYSLLTKLPYVEPDALVLPPADGWSSVNATELRKRGKTEEVIELLRRLPYLRAPAPGRRWMIGPDTIEIAYCDGELYDDFLESIQPVPAHCIWLTKMQSRDGNSLVLDTQTGASALLGTGCLFLSENTAPLLIGMLTTYVGTITECTIMEHKLMLDYEDYIKVPIQDRWMAHATMPASAFFQLWKRKFEKLVWMIIYSPRGLAGTAKWHRTATTPQEEEDMLPSDDEFQPDGDASHEVEDETELDGEDEDNEEGRQISTEEVDELMEDAYGEEAKQRRTDTLSPESTPEHEEADLPYSAPANQRQPLIANLHPDVQVCLQYLIPIGGKTTYVDSNWLANASSEYRKCTISIRAMVGRQTLTERNARWSWLTFLAPKKIEVIVPERPCQSGIA